MTGAGEPRLRQSFRLANDQQIAPRAGVDQPALVEMRRPELRGDLQEFQRDVPVARELGGASREESAPGLRLGAHLVHEAAERGGEPCRVGRRRRDDQLLVGKLRETAHQRARPGEHQPGQHELPLHGRHGGRADPRPRGRGGSPRPRRNRRACGFLAGAAAGRDGAGSARGWRGRRGGSAGRSSCRRARRGCSASKSSISRPSSSAATSVSRNGAPGGNGEDVRPIHRASRGARRDRRGRRRRPRPASRR